MKKLYTLLSLPLLCSIAAAQTDKCAAMPNLKSNSENIPGYAQKIQEAELKAQAWQSENKAAAKTAQTTVTIPVVFHCVYKNTSDPSFLHDSIFQRQLIILNETFGKTNSNFSNTRPIFDTIAANTDIQFCFAAVDPQGNPTSGINRFQSSSSFAMTPLDNGVKIPSKGGVAPWDPQHYLNIWSCDMSFLGTTFVLGYAAFPGGPDSLDGVVIQYQYVGHQNTGNSNNLGRTGVHEAGHWLGMRHIWGDGQQASVPCDSTDYVDDTPHASAASQSDCDASKNTCDSTHEDAFWTSVGIDPPDMIENYMDYSSDACMTMFTKGQKERMWSFLNTIRTGLLTNTVACGVIGVEEYNPAFGDFIHLYPSPSTDFVNVNFSTTSIDDIRIEFYNAEGRLIKTIRPSGFQNIVNISELNGGLYFVKISNNNNTAVKKLMVN